MRLALFDLDNTLLAGDSDYEWGQFLVDRGVLVREAYEAQNRAFYEQYQAGTLDIHEFLGFALRPLAEHAPEELDGWRRDPLRWNAPGGERLTDAAARVRVGVETVASALAGRTEPGARSPVPGYSGGAPDQPWALLVAHDGIFRLALLALLGLPLDRFWAFPFVLCGITVLELRDGRVSLIAHNLAEHLAPLAAEAVAETEARDRAGAL
jgi:broad specificity phosphatase PhoE